MMPQLRQIPNVGLVWHITPADEVTNFEQQSASSNVQSKIPEDEVMHSEEVVVKEEVDGAVHGNVVDSEELVVREVDDKAVVWNVTPANEQLDSRAVPSNSSNASTRLQIGVE